MSNHNLPFSQFIHEGSLDYLDVKSANLEQDEKAENAKEEEFEFSKNRVVWKRISYYCKSSNTITHPFLSAENEKDLVLVRSLNKYLPFKGSRSTGESACLWQRVADVCSAAKTRKYNQPLFKREVTVRGCKGRFLQYMKFVKEQQGKYNKEDYGEILTAVENLYEEYTKCFVVKEDKDGKLKWKKKTIPEMPTGQPRKIPEMPTGRPRKRILVDNDEEDSSSTYREKDSSSIYREKARMLREQNIARKLKLKAFQLKLKEKELMVEEQEAEERKKERKETRDHMMTMFNSYQKFTSTMMTTMMSTTQGTTSTSLPKADKTLMDTDRHKNGTSCDSEDDDDIDDHFDDDDDDDESSVSSASHYGLPI